jgi:uncharacterized membrane protein
MLQVKKIKEIMSLILTIGMLISVCFVLIGGCLYLLQFGNDTIQNELKPPTFYVTNVQLIWQQALVFSPLGLIELGLLALVGTQVVRVGLLVFFYSITKDYIFTLISLFILLTLLYSLFWRAV